MSPYSQPSFLYFGSHVLQSEEGPQQGDPLGMLLSCITIHSLITSMGSDLMLSYPDDLTPADPQEMVSTGIQRVMVEGSKISLC